MSKDKTFYVNFFNEHKRLINWSDIEKATNYSRNSIESYKKGQGEDMGRYIYIYQKCLEQMTNLFKKLEKILFAEEAVGAR